MEEEQALNNENLNNEENVSAASSNSTLKDVASNVADAVRDRKYKSRKNNTSNIDSSNISGSKGNSSKTIGNPANKLKNNLKNQVANQALNKAANLHPALKTAMMLNNIRKNGLFNKQKKNENDSSSNEDSAKDTSNDNNNSAPDSNENGNEKSSFNPVSSLLGSNFKGNFSFLGKISLKTKIAIFASGFFLTIFIAILAPVIIVSAFDSLLEIDDGSSSSGSNGDSTVTAGSYVEWAISIANDDSHGYSQCNRTGPDYDCSSFVYYSLLNSGYSKEDIGTYPFTSSNLSNVLTKIGFKKRSYVESELQSGDILWRSGHTGIYIGDGKIVHASRSENKSKCGKTGDQTGKEILVTTNTGKWTAYFRKEG